MYVEGQMSRSRHTGEDEHAVGAEALKNLQSRLWSSHSLVHHVDVAGVAGKSARLQVKG
jgi:hypothetical protein